MIAFLKTAAFVLPLGLDTFAVALTLGMRGAAPLRPAVTFALFETIVPLGGIALAAVVSFRFAQAAEILGGLVLIGLGVHAFLEAREADDEAATLGFTTLRAVLLSGFAVSIDELAIGFPMATERLALQWTLPAIGAQAFAATLLGMRLGARLGDRWSERSGQAAGIAFAALGLWLIVSHIRG